MAQIVFDKVSKVYDSGHAAVRSLELEIRDGEFLVLVGPSGCGKTTALRMIAGLEDVTEGKLVINGEVANDLSPRDRNIAMVFQSYALYPHLSVRDNIAFGLRVRRVPGEDIAKKVAAVADLLELTEYLDRKPAKLSGGQRQRVAMGRALVRSPNAFLMDEPLSNLDARLRGQMRSEIAKLQRMTAITTVYVTHDQIEAMTMGDRVAVMNQGKIQQLDTPRQLYDKPANLFVASFIGSPPINFLAGEAGALDGLPVVRIGDFTLPLRDRGAALPAGKCIVGIRPEAFQLEADGSAPGTIRAVVDLVEDLGANLLIHMEVPSAELVQPGVVGHDERVDSTKLRLRVTVDGYLKLSRGDTLTLSVNPSAVHIFDPVTGVAL